MNELNAKVSIDRKEGFSRPAFAVTPNGPFCRLKLTERLTIRLPQHVAHALKSLASRNNVPPSDLVRQLILQALVENSADIDSRGEQL